MIYNFVAAGGLEPVNEGRIPGRACTRFCTVVPSEIYGVLYMPFPSVEATPNDDLSSAFAPPLHALFARPDNFLCSPWAAHIVCSAAAHKVTLPIFILLRATPKDHVPKFQKSLCRAIRWYLCFANPLLLFDAAKV